MPFDKKPLPPPSFNLVFHPERDADYVHFEHARRGLESVPFAEQGSQGYLAWQKDFALVAFRGTEPDVILDHATNLQFELTPWDEPGEQVHSRAADRSHAARYATLIWNALVDAVAPAAAGRSGPEGNN